MLGRACAVVLPPSGGAGPGGPARVTGDVVTDVPPTRWSSRWGRWPLPAVWVIE